MTMAVNVTVSYGNHDPTKLRLAELDEIEDVMAICRFLHRENGAFPLDENKVRERMEAALGRKHGIIGVIGDHRKIEAIMFITFSIFWYTGETHLEELFSYVLPKYRKSTHARTLIEWAKEMADTLGMRLFIGIVSTIRTEAKIRLYRRQLGPPVGAYFIYGSNKRVTGNGTEH